MAKRILDILICFMSMPLVLPIMLGCSILVAVTGPPIFFKQKRIGKDGKIFTMLKFRSMVVDAPDVRNPDGSTFNGKDDPRVTAAGKWLRKTSLDEIPQILNVLLGDMSIVGPRPDVPDAIQHYRERDYQRLSVQPGITGLAQISGRNSLSWEERRDLDVTYVRSRNLWLDIKVIVLTVPAVLFGHGVYIAEAQSDEKKLLGRSNS